MVNLVNDGTYTEIERVPWGQYELATSADEGAVGSCSATVDDDPATFGVRGHRQLYFYEDEATADDFGGVIFYGRTAERDISRGTVTVEDARRWDLKLVDTNGYLSTRVMVGEDCQRPDGETDLETVAWLMATNEMGAIDQSDDTYIDSTGGVVMSNDRDYTGQTMLDVLDDCAQQSGRNYFLFPEYSGDPDARVSIKLWYKFAASTDFSSAVKISNVLADIDSTTYYAPALETTLTRAPDLVCSGVWVVYDGGAVYVVNPTTRATFMSRDMVLHAENVKTEAAAIARGMRVLDDVNQERDTIKTAIQVRAEDVNCVVAGHRIENKYSHLPGYEAGGAWMRVTERTVRAIGFSDDNSTIYELALTLVGPSLEEVTTGETPEPGSAIACVNGTAGLVAQDFYPLGNGTGGNAATTPSPGVLQYFRAGIGERYEPTDTHINSWQFPVYGAGGVGTQDYAGANLGNALRIVTVAAGTLTIDGFFSHSTSGLWKLVHYNGVSETVEQSGSIAMDGTPPAVTVPLDDHCYHTMVVYDWTSAGPGRFTFEGAHWEPETT